MVKSESDNNKADQEYVYGDDSVITLKGHTSRTVNMQAAWFLPYLERGMTLLDVGCASGSITVGLAKVVEPGEVIGIDMLEAEIERARERAAYNKLSNTRFEVGNAYQLDFPDNSFDTLFSHNVLEHIPEPSKALQEMKRVLKSGGIIGIRDVDWGGVIIAPEDELLDKGFRLHTTDWESIGGHPRIGRHLGRLLTEAGFVEVKTSASDETNNDSEKRRLGAQVMVDILSDESFVNGVTSGGLTNAEELEAIRKAFQNWPDSHGAFSALTHCEAIGRKA